MVNLHHIQQQKKKDIIVSQLDKRNDETGYDTMFILYEDSILHHST